MERGAFREAFSRISDVRTLRPDDLFSKVGLMADAGLALQDASILKYSLYLLEQQGAHLTSIPAYAAVYWLDVANLRSNLLQVEAAGQCSRLWYRRSDSRGIREAYTQAAQASGSDEKLSAMVAMAHGAFLRALGRDWEAFDFFHKASLWNPQSFDAVMGRCECLVQIAGTAPSLEALLLQEAVSHLGQLAEDFPQRRSAIASLAAVIRDRLGTAEVEDFVCPINSIVANNDEERTMMSAILRHRLYLSPCAACHQCDHAVGDAATLGLRHATVGGATAERFRQSAILLGRVSERYRALRNAYIHYESHRPLHDGSNRLLHQPEVSGWVPHEPALVALRSVLAGSQGILQGLDSCVSLLLGGKSNTSSSVLGTSSRPSSVLQQSQNPSLHGFWDCWADGVEKTHSHATLSLQAASIEDGLESIEDWGEEAKRYLQWISALIGCFLCAEDRSTRDGLHQKNAWVLQPFVYPSHDGSLAGTKRGGV